MDTIFSMSGSPNNFTQSTTDQGIELNKHVIMTKFLLAYASLIQKKYAMDPEYSAHFKRQIKFFEACLNNPKLTFEEFYENDKTDYSL